GRELRALVREGRREARLQPLRCTHALLQNRRESVIEHPPGADVTALPVTGLEIVETHSSATAGRMQEASIPDIDAGMVHPLATGREQHQVTGLQCIGRGLAWLFAEAGGGSGQSDPSRLLEHVIDQSAAVEAGLRGAATPAVGRSDQAEVVEQDLVMERGLGGRLN